MCPNWTPSPDHISYLQQSVNHLTNRRATIFEAEYPLTFEQVIKVTAPPELAAFVALGFDSMRHTQHISYELGPEQGLGRRSITYLRLPSPIPYAFDRQLQKNYLENNPIYFNRTGIDDETMEKLKAWTEKAVYERRLAHLVADTVVAFFAHMPQGKLTMYHIMARWPGLKVVFPFVGSQYNRGTNIWQRHSNEVPRDLKRWGWPAYGAELRWRDTYLPRLQLAEETLLSCVSLAPEKTLSHRRLTARLASWQALGRAPF